MERRIGGLAAEGRSNGQIAHDLYVTTKTVEWHLANVFRKLGVSTRQQLPPLDDSGQPVPAANDRATISRSTVGSTRSTSAR
jgi:Bacterial regulatory proteins, luxR family